jgi:hypothetical protein
MKTTNSGVNWNDEYNPLYDYLESIFFVDQYNGWICGDHQILKTTNAGINWTIYTSGNWFISIQFISQDTGWVIDEVYGAVKKTIDGGVNWINQLTSSSTLFSVFFVNHFTGWVVGSNGVIYKTTNGGGPVGIESYDYNIPKSFSLSQNYPNPFNPSTEIKFSIPSPSPSKMERGPGSEVQVSLRIYDILGRELATLVSEQLKPGTYEYEWDGSNFASGIYFYKLETEDFSQTKRMVLIK